MQMEHPRQNILGKYTTDLAQTHHRIEPLEPEAIGELGAKLEKDRQGAIDSFGELILLALNEHEELKTRYEFLTAQVRPNRNKSLSTLQTTITRINAISRKRFAETFEGVKKCFQEIFTRLFPGGRMNSATDEEPPPKRASISRSDENGPIASASCPCE